MQSVDGDVRLSVSFDMKSVKTNLIQLKKAIKDTLGNFDNIDSKVTPQVTELEKELENATTKINKLTKEVEKLSKTKINNAFNDTNSKIEKAVTKTEELKKQTENVAKSTHSINAEYDDMTIEMEHINKLIEKAVSTQKNQKSQEVWSVDEALQKTNKSSYAHTKKIPKKSMEYNLDAVQHIEDYEKNKNAQKIKPIQITDSKSLEKITGKTTKLGTNINFAQREMQKFNSELPEGSSRMQTLQLAVKKAEDNVAKLAQKLNEVGNTKIPTKEYTEISAQITTAERGLNKIAERQAELVQSGKNTGKTWDSLILKSNNIVTVLNDAKIEMANLVAQNKAFTPGSKSPEYIELVTQLKNASAELQKAKTKVQELEKAESKSSKTGKKVGKSLALNLKPALKRLSNLYSKVKSVFAKIGSIFSSIRRTSKSLSATTTKSFSTINRGVKDGIKSLLKYGLSIKSLYILIRKLKGYTQEGLTNLAGYSDSINTDISNILSALAKLKNALATLVQPIITAVQPVITSMLNTFSDLATKIGEFFAAFTGQNYVYKAVDTEKKFVDALDDTADSADNAKKSLDEYLSPLDDLNKFNDDNSKSADSAKTKDDSTDPSKMFTTDTVSDKFKNLASDLKKILQSSDWTELGTIIGEKLNSALEKINWTKIIDTLHTTATRIYTLLNGFITSIDWALIGQTIANGITAALEFLYTLITGFNWAQLGEAFGTAINNALSSYNASLFAKTLSNLISGIGNTLISLISTIDWNKFSRTVITFLQNIKWNDLGKVSINLIKALSDAIKSTDFKSIGKAFKKGINNINWKGIWNGVTTVVTDLIQSISDLFGLKGINTSKLNNALKKIYDPVSNIWQALKTTISNGLNPIINNLLPSIVDLIGNIFDGISPVLEALNPIFELFINDVSKVIEAISPVIVTIGETIGTIVEALTPIIEPILNLITKVVEILAPALDLIVGLIGNIFGALSPVFDMLSDIFDSFFTGVDTEQTFPAELQKELDHLSEVSGNLNTISDNIDTAISSVDQSLSDTQGDLAYIEDLQGRMDTLLSKSTLSDSDMQELNTIADLISDKLPDFKNTWDQMMSKDEDGKLHLTGTQSEIRTSIDQTISKLKEQYATQALAEQYNKLYSEQISANQDVAKAMDSVKSAQDKANDAIEKYNLANNKLADIGYGEYGWNDAKKAVEDAKTEMDTYNGALETAETDLLVAQAKVGELEVKMGSLDGTMKVINDTFDVNKDNLQDLRDAYSNGFIDLDTIKKKYKIDSKELFESTKGVGEQTVAGYIKGIQKGKYEAMESGVSIGASAIDGAKKELDIRSPSKKFKSIADYTIAGFSNEIEKDTKAKNSVIKWAKTIIQVVKATFINMSNPAISFVDKIKHVFNTIPTSFRNILNTILNDFESFFNYTITGINNLIDNLNIANKNIGQSTHSSYTTYGKFSSMRLPKLATGAVIPPNKEFLAILGDQTHGKNIEAPENLIRQIVREELSQSNNKGNTYEIPLVIGRQTITKLIIDEAKLMMAQSGENPFELIPLT